MMLDCLTHTGMPPGMVPPGPGPVPGMPPPHGMMGMPQPPQVLFFRKFAVLKDTYDIVISFIYFHTNLCRNNN